MTVLSKRTAITLACATALGALITTPSLAGVISPTDKAAVSTESSIDSVYYGWCGHRRHHYYWRGCHTGCTSYPYYSYAYPYGPYASAGWGWGGWGGGLLGAGLFGIL